VGGASPWLREGDSVLSFRRESESLGQGPLFPENLQAKIDGGKTCVAVLRGKEVFVATDKKEAKCGPLSLLKSKKGTEEACGLASRT